MKQKQQQGISSVILTTKKIGDSLNRQFEKDNEIKKALGAISAYRTSVSGAKTQLQYQKAMNAGEIEKPIPFLEQ